MNVLKQIKDNVKLTLVPNKVVKKQGFAPRTIQELESCEFLTIQGSVPGNFELDLLREGLIEDPYYSTNPIKMQQWEATHVWYYTTFDLDAVADENTFLVFEGIDTVADIYINGEKVGHTDNMFIKYEFPVPNLKSAGNELVVHITPATIYARQFCQPAMVNGLPYNCDSLALRKSPSSFGWDIMPRLVSSGLWRDVYIVQKPEECIEELYLFTNVVEEDGTAQLNASFYVRSDEDFIQGLRIEITGVCGDSTFTMKKDLFDANGRLQCKQNFKLWYPKNYGEQNLYDVTARLYRGNELKDEKKLRFGVRKVELERTSTIGKDGGEFVFKINGKRIFILGTNFVPLSPYHSEDKSRYQKALAMVEDIGCNAIRCWGGSVYEDDEFFEYCDEKGILVWQDFMMGCAVYPHDERFVKQLEEEATFIVKKLRNHPSLLLWSGDNECDLFYMYDTTGYGRDPNRNILTREVLSNVVFRHDHVRPYLPSSPFVDEYALRSGEPLSEEHLWGPRDYFKGDYYRTAPSIFASEIGYHGCPKVSSLKKFISPEKLWPIFDEKGVVNDDWLAHAANMELKMDTQYSYRIGLMAEQVKTLFGFIPDNLPLFSMLSMISQAEAKKYFIERFRIKKWERTGIIWWNLLDGWPQISDAVVDFYFEKKLAYDYIKRSQAAVCFIFDEPKNETLTLYGVNDTDMPFEGVCVVTDVENDEKLIEKKVCIQPHTSSSFAEIPYMEEQKCYHIAWEGVDLKGENHYYNNMPAIDYQKYLSQLRKIGFVGELEEN
jgi:beta-mannosidase